MLSPWFLTPNASWNFCRLCQRHLNTSRGWSGGQNGEQIRTRRRQFRLVPEILSLLAAWWQFPLYGRVFRSSCTTVADVQRCKSVPPDHLLLDRSPNIGPLLSHWELGKFKNCWNKSFRTAKILTLLYQQFLNLLISQQDMSGPRLGALSNNRWSGGSRVWHYSFNAQQHNVLTCVRRYQALPIDTDTHTQSHRNPRALHLLIAKLYQYNRRLAWVSGKRSICLSSVLQPQVSGSDMDSASMFFPHCKPQKPTSSQRCSLAAWQVWAREHTYMPQQTHSQQTHGAVLLAGMWSSGDFVGDDFLSSPSVSVINPNIVILIRNFLFHL
jgi:hypothetical protein